MPDARLIPPGSEELFVEASGGRYRVLRSTRAGPGVPLLLVHGGGSDNAAISWYRAFEPLSADRPLLAADLPGFGYTESVPVTGSAAGMADQLRELLAAAGLPEARREYPPALLGLQYIACRTRGEGQVVCSILLLCGVVGGRLGAATYCRFSFARPTDVSRGGLTTAKRSESGQCRGSGHSASAAARSRRLRVSDAWAA